VVCLHHKDAILYHDMINGRAITGVIHFINSSPIDTYSKLQLTVDTAKYGAEFVVAQIATDQVINLLYSTWEYQLMERVTYLEIAHQFLTSETIPHSSLKKQHNELSVHRVQEALAAGVMYFHKISGSVNPIDALSTHTGYPQAWLKPLLFCKAK
jgi:hypothetical protein